MSLVLIFCFVWAVYYLFSQLLLKLFSAVCYHRWVMSGLCYSNIASVMCSRVTLCCDVVCKRSNVWNCKNYILSQSCCCTSFLIYVYDRYYRRKWYISLVMLPSLMVCQGVERSLYRLVWGTATASHIPLFLAKVHLCWSHRLCLPWHLEMLKILNQLLVSWWAAF